MNQALEIVKKIDNDQETDYLLLEISVELLKQKKIEESIDYFQRLKLRAALFWKLERYFFRVLIEEGYTEDLLHFVSSINEETVKNISLSYIAKELSRNGHYNRALEITSIITTSEDLDDCLKEISNQLLIQKGYFESKKIIHYFKNDEIKSKVSRYLINENLCFKTVDLDLCLSALKGNHHEYRVVFDVLQMYAFNQVFSENKTDEKIHRFNQTLDIQWAIDINNQLN